MQNVCWCVGSDACEVPVDWDAEALRQDAAAKAAPAAQEIKEGNNILSEYKNKKVWSVLPVRCV